MNLCRVNFDIKIFYAKDFFGLTSILEAALATLGLCFGADSTAKYFGQAKYFAYFDCDFDSESLDNLP